MSDRKCGVQEIFRHNLLDPAILRNSAADSARDADISPVVCMVMSSTGESTTATEASVSAAPVSVPLYELCRGVSAHSNAFGCAAKCGTLVNTTRAMASVWLTRIRIQQTRAIRNLVGADRSSSRSPGVQDGWQVHRVAASAAGGRSHAGRATSPVLRVRQRLVHRHRRDARQVSGNGAHGRLLGIRLKLGINTRPRSWCHFRPS